MGLYEYMEAGGSIMWVILALSAVALAVFIERLISFRLSSESGEPLERAFSDAIVYGGPEEARRVAGGKTSLRRVYSAACRSWDADDSRLKIILDGEVAHELSRWEKRIYIIEVVARVAPLLGLLGTVLGMVEMFRTLNIGGGVSAEAVTGGIWKALFTTVAGLSVAIPATLAHTFLMSIIDKTEDALGGAVSAVFAARSRGRG